MVPAIYENMFLRDNYYRIKGMQKSDQDGLFVIRLLPESGIFKGHFPDNPVGPGVCGIEIIRECACLLTGWKLTITDIKKCRFTNVMKPDYCRDLTVYIHTLAVPAADCFSVVADITDGDKVYISFKGDMRL